MISFMLVLLLLLVSLLTISLRKTYYYLPSKELKRQAEAGDKVARALWRAVAYDVSLRILLWLVVGLSAAGGFVLLASLAPWWVAFAAITLLLWIAFAWFPRRVKLSNFEARVALFITPALVWLLNYLHPVFDYTFSRLAQAYSHEGHTNLYEADDLLELLERQQHQSDNRVSEADLELVKRALSAHAYKISDVLTSRSEVKTVRDSDTISLVLLDELHASGQSSFPVVKGKTDKVIGALYLNDLGLKTEGKVRDYMHSSVRYLHEDDSLLQALQAFFKTKQQLFVVVNSFEEYVGIVTLEHVIQQLVGELEPDDFDQHGDLAAVANKHAHDDDEPEIADVESEPAPELTMEPVVVTETGDELTEPEPETELVTDEPIEKPDINTEAEAEPNPEDSNEAASDLEAEIPNTAEPTESANSLEPDNLAALDLPDEEEETTGEGAHITFEKPKTKK